MKVLRRLAEAKGHVTTGSDITLCGHDEKNVKNADVAVYTTAVGEDNPEVVCARGRKIPMYERAQFLGILSREYEKVIAVAGSHGKTTATGFCMQTFLPKNPTVHIGGTVAGAAGRIGGNEYFITEACEYKRSFLHLNPNIAVILNIELDHTDYYKDEEDYFSAFQSFADNSETVVINGDDGNCRRIKGKNVITFGLGQDNYVRACNIQRSERGYGFTLVYGIKKKTRIKLGVPSRHNIYNALAAAAVGFLCGLSPTEIKTGLESFHGAARRFELLGVCENAAVYSDYAHHPTEITATVKTAREVSDGKRVTLVFEPHTYSRLKSLLNGFAQSLAGADRVIVAPVFAAREKPPGDISAGDLVREIENSGTEAVYIDNFLGISEYLSKTASDGETVVFTGAGDIDKAARLFVGSHGNSKNQAI